MEKNPRREFLKKSFLGLTGAAMIPESLKTSTVLLPGKKAATNLPARMLGKTGISTPLISMGTSGASNARFIRTAYDTGIKLFFSATYYGEGNNEKLVGEGLSGLPRDSFVVGTAVPPDGLDTRTGLFTKPFNTEAYLQKADQSLRRFGLDHVDFLLLPYAGKRETVLNEGVLKAMERLKKEGKTRFTGIASHSDTEEALKAAVDSGIYDVAMIAYNFKIPNKDSLHAAMNVASKAGLGILAMKTTAGAFRNKTGSSALSSDTALKWVLQNEHVACIVSGMSSVEELQKNLAMIRNLKMSDQELKDLDLTLRNEPGLYCSQCKECLSQCRENLDIPTIMRSYMYAYGYRNLEQAFYALDGTGISGGSCNKCPVCTVHCPAGFDVRDRVTDIARLQSVPKDFLMV